MNDKFGQFDWKCWKDHKPEEHSWIYIYYDDGANDDVEIAQEHDISFDDYTYWAYVFIPDAPKIEKTQNKDVCLFEEMETIQFFIRHICNDITSVVNRVNMLDKKQELRIDKIEHTLNKLCKILRDKIEVTNPFSDGG